MKQTRKPSEFKAQGLFGFSRKKKYKPKGDSVHRKVLEFRLQIYLHPTDYLLSLCCTQIYC